MLEKDPNRVTCSIECSIDLFVALGFVYARNWPVEQHNKLLLTLDTILHQRSRYERLPPNLRELADTFLAAIKAGHGVEIFKPSP